ncbi:MAG: hypothetical protein IPM24_15670 [Bryobacterales bacterium]|nr:hypothetical protein [Bryobacterales bacterium]
MPAESNPVRPWERAALAAILVFMLAALTWQAWRLGVTVDEPSHMLSAALYWQGRDVLLPRDMPPVIKIAGGWVVNRFPLNVEDAKVTAQGHEWALSRGLIMDSPPPVVQRLVFYSRLPFLIFPVLIVWLLWRWGRSLWGPAAALAIAALFVLEPTALGHGAFFKNDLAATSGYFVFWYRLWRFWSEPTRANAAWLGAGLLLAISAKLSMLVLVAVAPAAVLLRWTTRRSLGWRWALQSTALLLAVPYFGTMALCQFDVRRLEAEEVRLIRLTPGMPKPVIGAAKLFRHIPVAMPTWQGAVSLVRSNNARAIVYRNGRVEEKGHPFYFAGALGVKTPAALLGLLAAGFVLMLVRRHPVAPFLLIPPLLYIGLASLSHLQLGVRLILPALPFGLLLCGPALAWRRGWIVGAAAVAAIAVQTARVYPHGLAYFNEFAGGPANGLRYLSDSNLDWGQSLPDLAAHMRRRGIQHLTLSYFGMDSPWRHLREDEFTVLVPPWEPEYARGEIYQPAPGLYAISASLLPGPYFRPEYRDYYREFRRREPIARPGHGIYIYEIPE